MSKHPWGMTLCTSVPKARTTENIVLLDRLQKFSAKMSQLTQPHFDDVACDFSDFLQKPAVSNCQPRRWFRNWIFPVLSSWRLDTCNNVVWKGGQLLTRQLISQTYSKNSIAWRRNRKSPIRQVSFVLSSWKCSWNWFSYEIHDTVLMCDFTEQSDGATSSPQRGLVKFQPNLGNFR